MPSSSTELTLKVCTDCTSEKEGGLEQKLGGRKVTVITQIDLEKFNQLLLEKAK